MSTLQTRKGASKATRAGPELWPLTDNHIHRMTIGWIEQFIDEGKIVDGFPQTRGVKRQASEEPTNESPESEEEDRSPSPGSKRRKAKGE